MSRQRRGTVHLADFMRNESEFNEDTIVVTRTTASHWSNGCLFMLLKVLTVRLLTLPRRKAESVEVE